MGLRAPGRAAPRPHRSAPRRFLKQPVKPSPRVPVSIGPMLVLTRKSKQSIMIGDEIQVSVLAVMGDKVRIGIEAPRSVPVFRTEVYLEIQGGQGTDAASAVRKEVDAALDRLGAGRESRGTAE